MMMTSENCGTGAQAATGNAKDPASLKRPLVILGVTGSIAAYKACLVARALVKEGCRVKVILTEHGAKFVGAPTFHALTGEAVETELFSTEHRATNHIDLAHEADLMLVAPATANIIAKLAWGVADDLLSTVAVATNAPLMVAPAMNPDMWLDVTVQANLKMLRERGVRLVAPARGEVVCGDVGQGKLADVEDIVAAALGAIALSRDLLGVRAVVTAGSTQEPIDPVRFIGNRSSGKMGYAIAAELADRGATVTLVSGPVAIPAPAGVTMVGVESASEMRVSVLEAIRDADILVGAAAVSDFRVSEPSVHKVHRDDVDHALSLTLVPNPDILAEVGAMRATGEFRPNLVLVGFAAEDGRDGERTLTERGRDKLIRKQVDLVVVNDIARADIGFDVDDNEVTIVSALGERAVARASKRSVAVEIVDDICEMIRR